MRSLRHAIRDWWALHVSDQTAVNLAREAIARCWGVPYQREITRAERHGMLLLERRGEVERDAGALGDLHWHQRPR